MDSHEPTVIEKVRRALGRTKPLEQAPIPPIIDEPIARLIGADVNLPDLFATRATDMKMKVAVVSGADLVSQLIQFLRENNCKKLALSSSQLIERLNILPTLQAAGFDAKRWDQISLDEIYDGYDCSITDVSYAVAETGSLVVEPSAAHGRALSLVPLVHVAIVEPKCILPDLLDLMKKLAEPECPRSNVILITGPSKTADIEMNVVTGVHGPNIVKIFLLS